MEIVVPGEREQEARDLLEGLDILGCWRDGMTNEHCAFKVLLPVEKTEPLMDRFDQAFTGVEGFNLVLLNVEAELPRRDRDETDGVLDSDRLEKTPLRISREELYVKISANMRPNGVYIAMVVLSTIVAGIGLLNNNVAVIIGAMVVAPLLGPNVGLAFATTLGDPPLMRDALKSNALGIAIAFALALVMGFSFEVDPENSEILSRSQVGISDIFLALAAGCAGVLSFTSGLSSALIGVMVAVALLPPLVVVGLLTGAGQTSQATGALLLLLTNIICLNLAGVTTFLVQGIRPRSWWKAGKARRATRRALLLWTGLLLLLTVLILVAKNR